MEVASQPAGFPLQPGTLCGVLTVSQWVLCASLDPLVDTCVSPQQFPLSVFHELVYPSLRMGQLPWSSRFLWLSPPPGICANVSVLARVHSGPASANQMDSLQPHFGDCLYAGMELSRAFHPLLEWLAL